MRVQQESLISTPEYKVIDPKYTIPKLPRVNKTQPFRWPDHPFYSGNCHLTGCCNWLNSNMYRSQSAVCNFGIFRFSAPGKMQEKVDGPLTVQYPCPCYILRMYALESRREWVRRPTTYVEQLSHTVYASSSAADIHRGGQMVSESTKYNFMHACISRWRRQGHRT